MGKKSYTTSDIIKICKKFKFKTIKEKNSIEKILMLDAKIKKKWVRIIQVKSIT